MPGRASAEAGGPKPRAAQPTSCAVCGENLSRAGNVADRCIIGVRLVFGDVAHGIADLFERDANAATLLTYLRQRWRRCDTNMQCLTANSSYWKASYSSRRPDNRWAAHKAGPSWLTPNDWLTHNDGSLAAWAPAWWALNNSGALTWHACPRLSWSELQTSDQRYNIVASFDFPALGGGPADEGEPHHCNPLKE
jgi:hypothetical protein